MKNTKKLRLLKTLSVETLNTPCLREPFSVLTANGWRTCSTNGHALACIHGKHAAVLPESFRGTQRREFFSVIDRRRYGPSNCFESACLLRFLRHDIRRIVDVGGVAVRSGLLLSALSAAGATGKCWIAVSKAETGLGDPKQVLVLGDRWSTVTMAILSTPEARFGA